MGKGRVREAMIVSPRSSLSLALPRSLSWWPRSPAQRQAVSPRKQTTSVARDQQTVGSPLPPFKEAGHSSRFRIQSQKTTMNDVVNGNESHAEVLLSHLTDQISDPALLTLM